MYKLFILKNEVRHFEWNVVPSINFLNIFNIHNTKYLICFYSVISYFMISLVTTNVLL